ncbi:MAG: hypothetical protein FJ319_08140 [SAR202 cluster bacterium]|nr:hypothetical protein [SAR202 cluster bacterium]
MLKMDEGKTTADLIAAMQATTTPEWLTATGGPGVAMPAGVSNATIEMEEGNYVLICVIPDAQGVPHIAKGMMKTLTVAGAQAEKVEEPEADITVDVKDFSFALSKAVTTGSHVFRTNNEGEQDHEAVLVQLMPGKTVEDFLGAFEPGAPPGPPPGVFVGGMQAMADGMHGYFRADIVPGNFVLLCFVPDEAGGAPHFALGMVEEFTVQ